MPTMEEDACHVLTCGTSFVRTGLSQVNHSAFKKQNDIFALGDSVAVTNGSHTDVLAVHECFAVLCQHHIVSPIIDSQVLVEDRKGCNLARLMRLWEVRVLVSSSFEHTCVPYQCCCHL